MVCQKHLGGGEKVSNMRRIKKNHEIGGECFFSVISMFAKLGTIHSKTKLFIHSSKIVFIRSGRYSITHV